MSDLHRTNINLYTSDVEYLRKHYGFGWTERAREALHSWVVMQKAVHNGGHQPLGNALSRRYVDNTEVPDNTFPQHDLDWNNGQD